MGGGYRGSGHLLLRPASCTCSQASWACPQPREPACREKVGSGQSPLRAAPSILLKAQCFGF